MGRFERYGQRVSAGDISGGSSEPDRNTGDTGRERDLGYGGPRQDRSNEIADKINKEREEKKKAKAEIFKTTDQGDYYDAGWAGADRTKPPKEVYGAKQAGVVPGKVGYSYQTVSPGMVKALGLDKLDPKTAKFFGYTPGSGNVPVELYQQMIEGSLVSGGEAVETKWHYDTDTPWASGDELDYAGKFVGTWDDLGAGEHPLFPGGLQQYYEDMKAPFLQPIHTGDGPGGGGGGWGGGGGGGYGGGYGGYGPAGGMTPEQMAGFYTPQANLQQAMINVHQTPTVFRKRGGIVSLLRLS